MNGLPPMGCSHVHDERAAHRHRIDATAMALVVCKQLTLPDVTTSLDGMRHNSLGEEGALR